MSTIESAGPEVVDDEAKPGDALIPTTSVEGLKELAEQLSKMHVRLHNVAYDLKTVAGNKQARRDRKDLVSTRTALVARAAELKRNLRASVAQQIADIDTDAEKMVAFVRKYEEPLDQQIEADEQRRRDEQAERDRIEKERGDAHRARIADITNVAVRAVGLSSAEIQQKIDLVTRITIDASYEEFEPHAVNAKASTLLSLAEQLSNAKRREADEELARQNALRLAQLERENAERQQREATELRERQTREAGERQQREQAEAQERRQREEQQQAEQRAAEARRAQSTAAGERSDAIRAIQRRALTASAAGMLALVTEIEAIDAGEDLGDFAGAVQKAKDDALHDLHEAHAAAVTREEERRRADDARQFTRMATSQIEGIRQQYEIAHVGRAPYYTGGNVGDVERIIAETEGWRIDAENFGDLMSTAQVVKDATLVKLREYLAVLIAKRDAPPPAPAPEPEPAAEPEVLQPPAAPQLDRPGAIMSEEVRREHGDLTDAADALPGGPGDRAAPAGNDDYLADVGIPHSDEASRVAGSVLLTAVVAVMKAATAVKARGSKPPTWSVPADEMSRLKAALRAVPLDSVGSYYAEDGTLMNADGTRSIFDDVAE